MYRPFTVPKHIIVQVIPCPRQPATRHKTCNAPENKDEHYTKKANIKKQKNPTLEFSIQWRMVDTAAEGIK